MIVPCRDKKGAEVLTSFFLRSINDAGWIVGNGLLDGNDQAFLLVPVREPNAAVLMAIGAALLMRSRGDRADQDGHIR